MRSTGCEIVSALFRLEKQTVWNAWRGFSEITDTLIAITKKPIGRTWMMSAKHAHFSFTMVVLSPAKEIASAPEQDSTAAYSASVKELVQITTLNNLDHFVLTGQL